MILYRIKVDTRYAVIGFTGKSYNRYFCRKMGLEYNPQFLEEPTGIVTFRRTDDEPLGDIIAGPASSLCIAHDVRIQLDSYYGEDSEFIECAIEGQPGAYYIWILNRFKSLIEPSWRPRSWAYLTSAETAWLPDMIRSMDDIVREETLPSRWYCVDHDRPSSTTFYNLVNANGWTGLSFLEEWRDDGVPLLSADPGARTGR